MTKARSYLCDWADCNRYDANIVVSITELNMIERKRFCCEQHAAAWLLRHAMGGTVESTRDVENVIQHNVNQFFTASHSFQSIPVKG